MPIPAGVSHHEAHTLSGARASSSPSRANLFPGGDPSVHMLGVPKSYTRVFRWVAISFVIGAMVAIILLGLFSL